MLLDTCALIWLQNADPMRDEAIAAIFHAGTAGGVFVSPISAWEIGLASQTRLNRPPRLAFAPTPKAWFQRAMNAPGVSPAPFTPEIAIDSSYLPGNLQNDPADRIIIATARRLDVPIVTRDRRIIDYARDGHVSVIAC
ncbi:MAG TPA: type II toxin-antitoxin system VapC family toxin [Stellaceae bacterium]|nr:type II toxin-antitoxin system VapC family toxin [Stellaceae bacterium]